MPYKIDWFAIFIFLGIVQGIFLSFFFFSKENRRIPSNVFEGLMVLSMAGCTFEIFLCYTGYIQSCLWLVDYSEFMSFIIGPSFYLMMISLVKGRVERKHYFHYAAAAIWLLLQVPFLIQGEDVKWNAWIGAYHPPGLDFRHVELPAYFYNPPYHSEIILLHLTFYTLLGLALGVQAFREKKESIFTTQQAALRRVRYSAIQTVIVLVMIFTVKIFHSGDTGDHLFAAYISIVIYLISFHVVRQSGFFKQASLTDQQKYKSSSLTDEQRDGLLKKLEAVMASNKPFMQPDFSLPVLADQLKVSVHQLSQVINEGLGKSFFEMTAEYRIEEAKRLLKEKANIKVEEIAEQVGYNSKSSFNTAFKKITGMTPSEWRSGGIEN
jgi:AraC-like DNA-binding protein